MLFSDGAKLEALSVKGLVEWFDSGKEQE